MYNNGTLLIPMGTLLLGRCYYRSLVSMDTSTCGLQKCGSHSCPKESIIHLSFHTTITTPVVTYWINSYNLSYCETLCSFTLNQFSPFDYCYVEAIFITSGRCYCPLSIEIYYLYLIGNTAIDILAVIMQ